jgi:hypothetical protein
MKFNITIVSLLADKTCLHFFQLQASLLQLSLHGLTHTNLGSHLHLHSLAQQLESPQDEDEQLSLV